MLTYKIKKDEWIDEQIYQYFHFPPRLVGEKVVLRSLKPLEDASESMALFGDPQVVKWLSNDVITNQEEAAALLTGYRDNEHIITWAIEDAWNKQFLGIVWIMPLPKGQELNIGDVGVRLKQSCWRQGYNKDVMKLIMKFSFEKLKVMNMYAGTWKENINASASLQSYGFTLVDRKYVLHKKYKKKDILELYGIKVEEWKDMKSKNA